MAAPNATLKTKIGFWGAVSILIGSVIGAGVFMKPSSMAQELGSPIWLLVVWILAGIFSLMGAMIYAELGVMMPQTGGLYIYFKRFFGDFFAFLYGWAAFAVINTASIAAIAFICAQYADHFLHLPRFSPSVELSWRWHIPLLGNLYPLQNIGVKSLAILLVTITSWLNYRSTRAGNRFQIISTFLKMAVIAALVLGLFLSGHGSTTHFVEKGSLVPNGSLLGGIIIAMTGAFFAYDGWVNITFVAGEIRQPQRNIPRSLFIGVASCILLYVLVNQAYLYILPVDKIAHSSLVASDAIAVALGNTSGSIVAAMIVVCTLGAINGNILASARVTYAMSQDGSFVPWAGKAHPKYDTPGNALWLQAIWIVAFIISGSFDMLADMFVFIAWLAYLFGAIGIFLARKKGMTSPSYKSWGYPWIPILFILFSAFYLICTVYSDVTNYLHHQQPVINSLLGLLLTSLGIPVFFYYRRKRVNGNSSS